MQSGRRQRALSGRRPGRPEDRKVKGEASLTVAAQSFAHRPSAPGDGDGDPLHLIIHIKATFNNTILTLTNGQGQVLLWTSAGSCGFKGTRKGTPFAAKQVVEIFKKKSHDYFSRCTQIKVFVSGVGSGRENVLRGLMEKNKDKEVRQKQRKKHLTKLPITLIREITKIAHNGCRPPKKRRL
uniref:Small ribosomal subunit protein uS11c n=2 Tax=Viridiplantae TaxID=33090 RepID=A0A386B1B3_9CHLO|nr:ribosomal protein S11 [Rhipiliopsis peltata]AYC65485.1 ribosomal protein S11 [Rhipiliopsis peltata]